MRGELSFTKAPEQNGRSPNQLGDRPFPPGSRRKNGNAIPGQERKTDDSQAMQTPWCQLVTGGGHG